VVIFFPEIHQISPAALGLKNFAVEDETLGPLLTEAGEGKAEGREQGREEEED